MYHQDLYYEDEDSDFETLGIPSDEETRHINEVPLQKGSKKSSSSSSVGMTHKPKIAPKPKWSPAMDISQINNSEESLQKRTQVLIKKKGVTTSTPAVTSSEKSSSSEKPSLPKQLSLQPQKMVASQKDTNVHAIHLEETQSLTCNDQPSLLNDVHQPSNLSNLKYGDDSTPDSNTMDVTVENKVELVSFVAVTDEDKNSSAEITKTNNGTSQSMKEDEDILRSLSIDSVEHDNVICDDDDDDDDDEVLKESHDELVDLPNGDEETAKELARLRLSSVQSDSREKDETDEDMSSPTWPVHRKHVFILSRSGKPVYTRYGCEDKLVGLFGIMQALVSIVEEDGNDVLR